MSEKIYIKETIVVEGKDDVAAVKRAVICDFIITHGFGITKKTFDLIEKANLSQGVIIFTDPDFAGEQIRARINKKIPGCKHAFLSKEEATQDDDIGIENASPESIIDALNRVREVAEKPEETFSKADLYLVGLLGQDGSSHMRNLVGRYLGIGYCSGKQFLTRLNHYGVKRQELLNALEAYEKSDLKD